MVELAARCEARAHELLAEARDLISRAANEGYSLDAELALVRLFVAEGEYQSAQSRLREIESRHAGAPAQRFVTVAPDVLGPRLRLDGNGRGDGDAVFTVISPYPDRAASAVAEVAPRLMDVNEHGDIQTPEDTARLEDAATADEDIPYTPNYLFDIHRCQYGPEVALDTKGWMTAPMGRKMVSILVDALVAAAIPAHVTGRCLGIDPDHWRVWNGP
jgi:hypothetical protein